MEPMTIFAISACILSAGIVYVVLKVNHSGESQVLADQLLMAQAETTAVKKKLLGYTKYAEHLNVSQQALATQLAPPVAKVTREYVYVEKILKETYKFKADSTFIVKYAVEFSFKLDASADGLTVLEGGNGVGLKISRPSLHGEPIVKTLSHQVISAAELPDTKVVLADITPKFAALARNYGLAISSEESVRALCKLKALEGLRDTLAKQPGVSHVPAIFADFK